MLTCRELFNNIKEGVFETVSAVCVLSISKHRREIVLIFVFPRLVLTDIGGENAAELTCCGGIECGGTTYLGQVIGLPELVFPRRSLALENLLEDSEIVRYVESIPRVLHRKQKMDFLVGQKQRFAQEGGGAIYQWKVGGGTGLLLASVIRPSTSHVS